MIALAACGAGVALGLVWCWAALHPAPPPISVAFARLENPAPARRAGLEGLQTRAGSALAGRMEAWGVVPARLRADLGVLGVGLDRFGALVVATTAGFLCIAVLALGAIAAFGVTLAPEVIAVVVVIAGAAGLLMPAQQLHAQAGRARAHMRAVVVSWVELVALGQAGGNGTEGSIQAACELGDDWALRRIAKALAAGRAAGVGAWEGLVALGLECGIDELTRTAASLSLASTEGADVLVSLQSAASSMRARAMAETEGKANALTERLFGPSILLAMGFMVFIIYPALAKVLGSLG